VLVGGASAESSWRTFKVAAIGERGVSEFQTNPLIAAAVGSFAGTVARKLAQDSFLGVLRIDLASTTVVARRGFNVSPPPDANGSLWYCPSAIAPDVRGEAASRGKRQLGEGFEHGQRRR
jgi:hypothetical protein